ncbi:MAG TPA: hypothetical protein DDW28_10175 [Prevotella sp.]|nr:hypothetical protein [Candidatus Segatella violae]
MLLQLPSLQSAHLQGAGHLRIAHTLHRVRLHFFLFHCVHFLLCLLDNIALYTAPKQMLDAKLIKAKKMNKFII